MSTRKRLIRKTPMQREREYHEKLLKERASRMYERNKLFYDAFGIRQIGRASCRERVS